MPRPEKPKSERRTGQIVVYVHEPVKEELQREADAKGISVSLLVRELLEAHVSGDKNDDRRIVVHADVIYAVLRQLQHEGFEISNKTSDKLAPDSKFQQSDVSPYSTYPQPTVDNPVDNGVDKRGDEFAPKTSAATSTGAKDGEQRGDDNIAPRTERRGKQGGEEP